MGYAWLMKTGKIMLNHWNCRCPIAKWIYNSRGFWGSYLQFIYNSCKWEHVPKYNWGAPPCIAILKQIEYQNNLPISVRFVSESPIFYLLQDDYLYMCIYIYYIYVYMYIYICICVCSMALVNWLQWGCLQI